MIDRPNPLLTLVGKLARFIADVSLVLLAGVGTAVVVLWLVELVR